LTRDEQASEDALQATFLTLVRKATSVSKRTNRVFPTIQEFCGNRLFLVPLCVTERDLLW
jgi:hypothetical protein